MQNLPIPEYLSEILKRLRDTKPEIVNIVYERLKLFSIEDLNYE